MATTLIGRAIGSLQGIWAPTVAVADWVDDSGDGRWQAKSKEKMTKGDGEEDEE